MVNNPSQPSGGQYFNTEPMVGSDPSTVELTLPDLTLTLNTDTGVFARKGVDPGTKLLLLDGPTPVDGDRNLLDVGCGYGPIALALAKRNPNAIIWAIDVNLRARNLCASNALAAGVNNVRVMAPEEVPVEVTFERIWSNPPIRIGKNQLHKLLAYWLGRLAQGGSAHLVVQKHLGADSLQKWLTNQGWPATRRSSRAAYRLLDVQAKPMTETDQGQQ